MFYRTQHVHATTNRFLQGSFFVKHILPFPEFHKDKLAQVYFKTGKSTLNLVGEGHSLSYDALTAHVAIVFARYMLLALEQRHNEDQRTLGERFFFLVDEMADITFAKSMSIIIAAMLASLQEILTLSDTQLDDMGDGDGNYHVTYDCMNGKHG